MTSAQRVLVHLSLIDGIGPAGVYFLVNTCIQKNIALINLYQFSCADFLALGLTQKSAQAVVVGFSRLDILDSELCLIDRAGAHVISIIDNDYPDFLQHIGVPPLVLYIRGNFTGSCVRNLAIVGSRHGTAYGRAFIDSIMPELAKRSWTIVSGGARGIDAMAHESALNNGAQTVVVLGSGLLRVYPAEHKKLFDRVVDQGGCLMTPFCMNAEPEPWRFPARNRIIAGISRGVLVVQAAAKSGAQGTASFALDYGREVFAVPGEFNDELSAGCHSLIKQGAVLVCSAHDLMQELDPQLVSQSKQLQLSIPEPVIPKELSLREKIVMLCRHGMCMDDLSGSLDLPMEQIYQELFNLQLDGVITQDFSGLFRTAPF